MRTLARAALVASIAIAVGCGGPPPLRRTEFAREWLVPPNVLQRWHEDKARLGPTFAGSPAWREHVVFVERELRDRGVVALRREPIDYQRWHTAGEAAAGQ